MSRARELRVSRAAELSVSGEHELSVSRAKELGKATMQPAAMIKAVAAVQVPCTRGLLRRRR